MPKKLTACILCAALAVSLCGCGSIDGVFETEYVSVTDYQIPEHIEPDTDRVVVRSFTQLKHAILQLITSQLTEGKIVFDSAYNGDIADDMASACWQLRTQDALCAYCVENISYELTKIVTYTEAEMSVSYSKEPEVLDEIVNMSYAIGIDEMICDALEHGERRLVLYIQTSNYTAEQLENEVTKVYRDNPFSCVYAPTTSVNMYSGTSRQRLYEINIAYGLNEEKLTECRQKLSEQIGEFMRTLSTGFTPERALEACEYLASSCKYSETGKNSAYCAIVEHEADDEGMALAFAGLCGRMGIECTVVYGQRDWSEHCWNIIKLDGDYYHVDVSACGDGLEYGFLRTDETMWVRYRWNTTTYPACTGALTYYDLLV